jgi:RND family efflux transporter MFP subunit
MKKRTVGLLVVALIVAGGAYAGMRWFEKTDGAVAQSPAQGPRSVSVEVSHATKKKMPVRVEALGTVAPIASVAVKTRVDSEITGVHFSDGAQVKQGDILITLDSRSIEAQVKQAEGTVARDQAQLEGAQRDVRRFTELVEKNATPVTNLENAKTQVAIFTAARLADEAVLANLKVQLSYTTIRAPISGRMSAASVKVGNFVRTADLLPIATIIQTAPIYVTFSVAQSVLPDIRQALAAETATIEAMIPGDKRKAGGAVTMIENTVDPGTGMVAVRATMPNTDEMLWPGSLVTVQMTLREEDSVVVPASAIQASQTGSFVFVVKDGAARVQPVTVARTIGQEAVVSSGLNGDETVVTDGHLLLTNGARVNVRERRTGT